MCWDCLENEKVMKCKRTQTTIQIKLLGDLEKGGKMRGARDADVQLAFRFWREFFLAAKPRVMSLMAQEAPALIFSDGACEGVHFEEVTAGAVLVLPSGVIKFFGLRIPAKVVKEWQCQGQEQTIGQAEIAPALLARLTWTDDLQGRRVVQFIDNDSARFALVKGYSPSLASSALLSETWLQDCRLGLFSWYDRVPTASNIGDGPSRLDYEEVIQLGGVWSDPVLPGSWCV